MCWDSLCEKKTEKSGLWFADTAGLPTSESRFECIRVLQ